METFRIFCATKKRTEPEGWFDPAGEHEHFSKAESGRQYQVPEPFLFFLKFFLLQLF